MKTKLEKLNPVVSEKSYALVAANKYTFMVPNAFTKTEIQMLVQETYNVTVVKVNSTIKPGKLKMNFKTRKASRQSDLKKVIVTLKEGDKIDEFMIK